MQQKDNDTVSDKAMTNESKPTQPDAVERAKAYWHEHSFNETGLASWEVAANFAAAEVAAALERLRAKVEAMKLNGSSASELACSRGMKARMLIILDEADVLDLIDKEKANGNDNNSQ